MYPWVDGIHSGSRAEDTRLCELTVIGVNERREKRFWQSRMAAENPHKAGVIRLIDASA